MLCTLPLAVAGCHPAQSAQAGRLVITGSSTVAPLVAEIGKRFEADSGVRVDVQTGGSSRGLADARQGLANIGMASRALKPGEEDLAGFAIAHDGICLIVHASNPIAELSKEQVVDAFTGKIADWAALGSDPLGSELGPISVVNKAEGRSTLELFLAHFDLDNRDIRASVVIGDNEQGIKTVAGNPGAIGYVSIGAAEHARDRGVPIKLLPLAGVEANTANLANGRFPLARPLTLVTHGEPDDLARRFIDFARSQQVHDLVRELSFVPVG
ncbi:MAG: phosphate ABC transporter substrate-binding protein [Acidobacteriota bacterium]